MTYSLAVATGEGKLLSDFAHLWFCTWIAVSRVSVSFKTSVPPCTFNRKNQYELDLLYHKWENWSWCSPWLDLRGFQNKSLCSSLARAPMGFQNKTHNSSKVPGILSVNIFYIYFFQFFFYGGSVKYKHKINVKRATHFFIFRGKQKIPSE